MGKVLLLGAGGMAGHVIYTKLKEAGKHTVIGTVNQTAFNGADYILNIRNEEAVIALIKEEKPDYIINCVGVLIKGSKDNPANAVWINAYFPHMLANACKEFGTKLIHISTDCVFSGAEGGYTETSPKNAKDIYGQSKGLGEVIDDRNLTIRTSIIGPDIKQNGEGLFHWFMEQEGPINGYTKAKWSGVTTIELANFVNWVLDQSFTGLVHLTNNMPISKFDLLSLFASVFKKIQINPLDTYEVDKSFINTNSQLTYKVPSYEEMLHEQKEFIKRHKTFYSTYQGKIQ